MGPTTGLVANTDDGVDDISYEYDNNGNISTIMHNTKRIDYSYDAIGNPLNYRGYNLTWQHGRQLSSLNGNGKAITYKKTGSNSIYYHYDGAGNIFAMNYNGTNYFYTKNAQGDIVGILDTNGNRVVTYTYDAWGKILSVTGTLASTIGQINPFRFRGYYYDSETGLYYLQSRYYDPEVGRFMNADGYVSTGQGLNGNNMFAYCGNNPVMRADPSGQFWGEIWSFTKEVVNQIGQSFKTTAPAYAVMGAGTFADGPLPFADAAMLIGAAVLTVGVI